MKSTITSQIALSKLHMRTLAAQPPSETVATQALTELSNALVELEVTNEELTHSNNVLADITAARDLEARRYRELFEHIPIACLVTDMWGVIEEANVAAGVLFHLASPRLIGKPITIFVPPDRRREFRDRMNNLPMMGSWEARLQLRDGLQVFVKIEVAAIAADDYSPGRLYWVLENTTGPRTIAAVERVLTEESHTRTEIEGTAARLRLLQSAMQSLIEDKATAIPHRVTALLAPLLPSFARSISCTFPGAAVPTIEIGASYPGRFILQAELYGPQAPNGQLTARRSTEFTPEDQLVFTCAANAVTAILCNSFNRLS